MAKGKNGLAAATRRLAEAHDRIAALEDSLTHEKAERDSARRAHADEVARLKSSHAAEVADKAGHFVDVEFERRVEAEVGRRLAAEERQLRREAGEAVGRWAGREGIRADPRAWTALADELNLGRDAAVIYGDHARSRSQRRQSVRRQNLNLDVMQDPSLVVKR